MEDVVRQHDIEAFAACQEFTDTGVPNGYHPVLRRRLHELNRASIGIDGCNLHGEAICHGTSIYRAGDITPAGADIKDRPGAGVELWTEILLIEPTPA